MRSLPAPPSSVSSPRPPMMTSLPASPEIVSLPAPPLRWSLPARPRIVSLPAAADDGVRAGGAGQVVGARRPLLGRGHDRAREGEQHDEDQGGSATGHGRRMTQARAAVRASHRALTECEDSLRERPEPAHGGGSSFPQQATGGSSPPCTFARPSSASPPRSPSIPAGTALAATIEGGPGNEHLRGTRVADHIDGNGGNDRIFGLAGDDQLIGGAGNDRVFGGRGNDTIHGVQGNDWLNGGAGDDTVVGDTNGTGDLTSLRPHLRRLGQRHAGRRRLAPTASPAAPATTPPTARTATTG